VLATACVVLTALGLPSARAQLRPDPAALAAAPRELVDRMRADPFTYFRFINRAWTARVCEVFSDVPPQPIVRLHGDAHLEQFALTRDAWGLDDFDDSARGPAFIDLVRFLGSIELAIRQRGWTRNRDALWNRFFDGYRRGLTEPGYRPPEPGIVRRLRLQASLTQADFLAWGESQMQPMEEAVSKSVVAGMETFDRLIRANGANLAAGYFSIKRAGWLRLGVGSSVARKVLIRVQGPTTDAGDDVLIEAKEVANLDGLRCLEGPTTSPALRVIDGTQQLGRLKHDILAIGPSLLLPGPAGRGEEWLDWWVSSWERSYREIRLSDLRSVEDLSAIVYDSGVQLGGGEQQGADASKQALSSIATLEGRLRKETSAIVEDLLAGWRELARR
jgi:hypothetical protein